MTTKESILELADGYIRSSGYHTFSFHDLSRDVGIKTASVHYHFPVKADLGAAVIRNRLEQYQALREETRESDPVKKLALFLSIYSRMRSDNKVCLTGSIATEMPAMDEKIQNEVRELSEFLIQWVKEILEEGRQSGKFHFETDSETKALMILSTMVGMLQISRISHNPEKFKDVMRAILHELQQR